MNSADVAQYLQNHPQFFEEYAELMSQLVIPHPHGGRAISITERQMIALRDKNRSLEMKMNELLNFGEENDRLAEKMHRLGVSLAAAGSLASTFNLLHYHLCDDMGIPCLAIRLWESVAILEDVPEFVAFDASLQHFADTLTDPYCGSTASFETSPWFGEQAKSLKSQALIPLRNGGGVFGLIALGSEDPERYYSGMGTLFLERLGELAAATLARVLAL